MHRNTPTEPAVQLRTDQFRRHAEKRGLTTDQEVAEHLGVSRTTVMRALNGQHPPGERLIAATLAAFPDVKFEDVFRVVGGDQAARPAPETAVA